MGFDIPDGPMGLMPSEMVGTTPIAPESEREWNIDAYNTKVVTLATGEVVHQWIVPLGRTGILRGISLACSDYSIATWTITMTPGTLFEDKKIPGPAALPFPDIRLPALGFISALMKSDGTTPITGYVYIEGKEVG